MKNFRVVLVRPKYSRNVGMVARAMSNYGIKQLILVEPRCELDQDAREGAAHAQEQLQKCQIYSDWTQFYASEKEGTRIAFSARDGKLRETFDFSSSLLQDLETKNQILAQHCYLIFGPEDHGLAESDLDFVHRVFQIRLPGENTSLNLSHAVLCTLTILHQVTDTSVVPSQPAGVQEPFFFPDQTLRRWLEALNIDLSVHERVNALTVLRKLILKGFPSSKELHMLETVLQQTIRKLKERDTK